MPPGKPLAAVRTHLGAPGPWRNGQVWIEPSTFRPLDDYDRLLWQCDVNFVRGEDSFVRAQWAGKPFVWQIYRQDEDAHLIKLKPFWSVTARVWTGGWKQLFVRCSWRNANEDLAPAWRDFVDHRLAIATHNRRWARRLALAPDLAAALVKFCAAKV